MAAIGIGNTTTTSISCYLYDLDTSYSNGTRLIYWYLNGILTDATYLAPQVYSGGDVTFNNLASGTLYSISAVVYYNYNGSSYEGSVTLPVVYAQTLAARPPFYYWTYSKVKGGAFNLTATEWNNLTANINAVRNYKGLLFYNFTTAYRGYQLTANMYNECIYAIGGMMSYNIASYCVYSGNPVTADSLNLLVNLINSIT